MDTIFLVKDILKIFKKKDNFYKQVQVYDNVFFKLKLF